VTASCRTACHDDVTEQHAASIFRATLSHFPPERALELSLFLQFNVTLFERLDGGTEGHGLDQSGSG
jgi:hypothetical protein